MEIESLENRDVYGVSALFLARHTSPREAPAELPLHAFIGRGHGFDAHIVARGKSIDDFLDEASQAAFVERLRSGAPGWPHG